MRPPHRMLLSARLTYNERTVAEASEASKATCTNCQYDSIYLSVSFYYLQLYCEINHAG